MKLLQLFAAAALFLCSTGCSDDKDEPVWALDGITVKSEIALANDTPQTLNIRAASAPSLSTDATWLHIGDITSPAVNIYSAELYADVNLTGTERTATIDVVAGSEKTTVNVKQLTGNAIEINEVTPSTTLSADGGEITVTYAATAIPEVSAPAWMTVLETTLTSARLSYTANTTGDRQGDIVFTIAKNITATVTVTQIVRDVETLSGKTAKEIAASMYAGVNIGNTMECPGGEGDWSQVVNTTYVAALADMGFNAVRIPCAWDAHAKDGVIDPAWLARVDEVVGWVINNGMYAMINAHWDSGWIEGDPCTQGFDQSVCDKFASYWTQIANQLNHYDQHLLFSAMNEPPVDESSKAKKEKGIDAIMRYEQVMLDAVRATGGNNLDRVLVMSVPNTNIELGVEGYFHMPTDVVADRLMVEAHYYGPYQFNMMEEDASWGKTFWYWGKNNHVADSDRNSTWGEEDYVVDQMNMLKTHFVDKGYPAVIGEYCVCVDRSNYPGIDVAKHQASLRDWNIVVTREAKNAGCVPFFWETGGHINRTTGKLNCTYQIEGVFQGAAEGKYPF